MTKDQTQDRRHRRRIERPAMSGFKMPEPGVHGLHAFTETQIRQAVIDALEMAAQLCDNKKGTLGAKHQGDVYAEAIRALKEQIK